MSVMQAPTLLGAGGDIGSRPARYEVGSSASSISCDASQFVRSPLIVPQKAPIDHESLLAPRVNLSAAQAGADRLSNPESYA